MRRGLLGRPEGEVTWVTGEARACEARARVYLQRAACSTAALVGQLHEAAAMSDARCLVQKLGPEQAARRSFRGPTSSLIDSAVGRELLEAEEGPGPPAGSWMTARTVSGGPVFGVIRPLPFVTRTGSQSSG